MNGPAPAALSGADLDAGDARSFGYPIHRFRMFKPIGPPAPFVTLFLDGQPITAQSYETLAACLLRHGIRHFRTTPVSGSPRLPYCMIGQCFDCLVEIEGIGSRQACLIQAMAGMRVLRQDGAARAGSETPQ
jgi:D-hydroxyproline dehydrogenase subunit gamma